MFNRLFNQIRGRISLFFSSIEFGNPEVLLENATNDLKANRQRMREGLGELAANSARLQQQISNKDRSRVDLEGRVLVAYNGGHVERAQELAAQLQELVADLAEDKQEFESNENAYKTMHETCMAVEKETIKKIERLKRSLSKAKAAEAAANVADMVSGVATKATAATQNLERLEEVLAEKQAKAAGRLRVAGDSPQFQAIRGREEERKEAAQSALANFLASRNITDPMASQVKPAESAPVQSQQRPSIKESES
jgi:phage shock protein A